MPIRCFRELKESDLISWIEHIRSANSSDEEKRSSELLLFQSLEPIVRAIARIRENAFDYDAEQIVNDAIYKLFLHYLRDPEFQFRSCGHIVSLLSRITINERRFAFRISGRAKRLPRDDDGHRRVRAICQRRHHQMGADRQGLRGQGRMKAARPKP